jgi:hypothetical protein
LGTKKREFDKQLQENPLLQQYLDMQFSLERSLIHVRHYKQTTGRMPSLINAELGELYSFVATTARVYRRLPSQAQKSLRDSIVGALKSDIGIAPFAFEMRTAAHFMAAGSDVDFHDLREHGGYDLLVSRKEINVEVECKSISADLGRPIHLRRQYQLGPYLQRELEARQEDGFVQLVIATLPNRLQGSRTLMEKIATKIAESLKAKSNLESDYPCSVSYHLAPIVGSPFDRDTPLRIQEKDVIDFCARLSGEPVGHTIMVFRPRKYAVIVALRSQQSNRPLRGISRILRDAASRQLSGRVPGIICVQFRNMTNNELRSLAAGGRPANEPSGLQVMTSTFFNNRSHDCIRTIAYLAPGNFVQSQSLKRDPYTTDIIRTTDIREDAVSYTFDNPYGETAGDSRYQFF